MWKPSLVVQKTLGMGHRRGTGIHCKSRDWNHWRQKHEEEQNLDGLGKSIQERANTLMFQTDIRHRSVER